MGKLIRPEIWESEFAPDNKNILWKKYDPSTQLSTIMKYSGGWVFASIDDIKEPTIPFKPVFREDLASEGPVV